MFPNASTLPLAAALGADNQFADWFGLRGGKILFTACSLRWIAKLGPLRLVRIPDQDEASP